MIILLLRDGIASKRKMNNVCLALSDNNIIHLQIADEYQMKTKQKTADRKTRCGQICNDEPDLLRIISLGFCFWIGIWFRVFWVG